MRPAKAASIQSSPMLLHASSPTIRRFNSNDSSTLVLAIASQDEDDEPRAVTPLLFSNPSSETMVGTAPRKDASSANIGAILASSPPIGSFDFIPETPRLSPVSPTAPKSRNLKAVSGDLSSDPISEFCTPLNSPSVNRSGRRPGNALPSAEHTCLLSSDPGYAANTDELANINSIPGEKYTQTSVTQWYHENLVTGNLAADSQGATGSIAATTITVFGTGESQSSDIAAHVGDSNEHVHHRDEPNDGCDDGYSSPLEGFWDLRKAAPNSLQDRDMYINQFGAKSPIRPSSHSDIAPALARPGPPIPMRPPLQAPARPRARGAAPVPRGGLRVPVTMSRAQSQTRKPRRSAIRPVLSSRTSLQHPTPRQPAAPVGYNHYADDPPSEFSGFLGFEGPGVSRFG
ncbi:hypothetical protein IWW50_005568 [Coemansia erecta]|nr:hypothetical protein IWW50_005568 [Coemansia erecta]